MRYRRLGSSDLMVSVVGLGAINFAHLERITDPAESARILNEENQRVREAEAQPEDKRAEALKWALAENNVYRLGKLIQRIKKSVNVPVTTGEIWNIWRDHPQLANSADFIGAHVLPY